MAASLAPVRASATLFLFLFVLLTQGITLPSGYDTIWRTQSTDSSGSMPVGGGSIGLNAWAESGNILLYVANGGAFDENNSLLKLGRIRLSMSPNPFAANASIFEQRLNINDGYVTFTGTDNTLLKLWVDVFTSVIHVEITGNTVMNLTASFETWRTAGYNLTFPESQQSSWGVIQIPALPAPYQYPDTVQYTQNGVLSYHHNVEQPLFEFQLNQQNLTDYRSSLYNPMQNNTFGTFMTSPQLVPGETLTGRYIDTNFTSFNLVANELSSSYQLYISTGQDQTTDVPSFKSDLIALAAAAPRATPKASVDWWHAYWDRSYIIINPNASSSDAGFQVGKNYQYFRYMMGCNAFGDWPTRFNGGLFTFDPSLVDSSYNTDTPDYRKWSGGTFTAQNQRLLYWPLLKTGDFDVMRAGIDFYKKITPNNRILGNHYFGIGATLFSEQIDNTGLPNVFEYDAIYYESGNSRTSTYPPGIDFNDPLNWLQDTANEFADIILQAKIYNSSFEITPYLEFIEYQLAWFDEYYTKRNGLINGKLNIYPGSGQETYKFANNSASTVSGLRKVIADLLAVDPAYIKGNRTYYESYFDRVPDTPLRQCPGATSLTCVAPATSWSSTVNNEPTALYTVFPWGEYGLGASTNLIDAIHAYYNDSSSSSYHGNTGWRQDQIWLARFGLTDEATSITTSRLTDSTTYRFSAFKGPNYDWSPDINHYGSAAIGLQEQLMQTFVGSEIRLLPAWPSSWTGYFKLHAPNDTTVTASITASSVENLVIRPESRSADVIMP